MARRSAAAWLNATRTADTRGPLGSSAAGSSAEPGAVAAGAFLERWSGMRGVARSYSGEVSAEGFAAPTGTA